MSRFWSDIPDLILLNSGRVTTFEAWPTGITCIEIREYPGSEKYLTEFIQREDAEKIIEYLKLRYNL